MNLEVLTPDGYKPFKGIAKTPKNKRLRVCLENGDSLQCSINHQLVAVERGLVFASQLEVGEEVICEQGSSKVSRLEGVDGEEHHYDLEGVEGAVYYAGGILSHNTLYLDEFAHIQPNLQQHFFTSVYPTISSGKNTKVIITSTPKGYELFAKIWMDAENGRNTYVPITCDWWEVPGRDEAWKEETIRNTSEEQFRQEYETAFLGSSDTLISSTTLRNMAFQSPVKENEGVTIYEPPRLGRSYFMTVDVSRGTGGDYSTFIVFDITELPFKQVAKYRSNLINPVIYPNYIYQASKSYNDAWILVETNDLGQQVVDILVNDLECESVLMVGTKGTKGQCLGEGTGKRFGLKTTTPVKRIGCANLKMLIEASRLLVCDYETISELTHFVRNGSSYSAESGYHDDLAMCLVLFAWASSQEYFRELADSNIRQDFLQQYEKKLEEDLTPFGFIDDGIDDYTAASNGWSKSASW